MILLPSLIWLCLGNSCHSNCPPGGVRNISNQLTIRTKIDKMSEGLKEHAQAKGWWSPDDGEFDFAKAYSSDFEETELAPGETPSGRQLCGTKLLQEKSKGGELLLFNCNPRS